MKPSPVSLRVRALAVLQRFIRSHPDAIRPIDQRAAGHSHVAVFKLRDFEALRTELGFSIANAVMHELADRLAAGLPGSQICRVGRTTLEVTFHAAPPNRLHQQLVRARELLQRPLLVDGLEVSFEVTCGAATLGEGLSLNESIDRASGALVRAALDRSLVAVNDGADQQAEMIGDFALARALKSALDAQELQLFYQPKLHCRTDKVQSVEALLRWTHAKFGSMPIDRVIAAAERTGIIRSLTNWVVERAVRDTLTISEAGYDITVFVNLSGRLIADRTYVGWLIDQAAGTGNRLGFEITETAVIDDPEDAIANVTAMSNAGIRIAIDDYGSGLSSLAYLKQLPAHELKIDRLFIRDLIESHRDPLLVRSSIDLAHALEMEVTAEGVDDPMILSLLRVMGIDIVQGFLIARALPLAELFTFLENADSLLGLGSATHALPEWNTTGADGQ